MTRLAPALALAAATLATGCAVTQTGTKKPAAVDPLKHLNAVFRTPLRLLA